MLSSSRIASASYVRNFVFGVEDGLASTVGLLSGVAAAGMPLSAIYLTGLTLIFVEAFSMAAGSFLSEYSGEEFLRRSETGLKRPFLDGSVMFCSYFVSGFIPLFPYLILQGERAFWVSVIVSLLALFLLGVTGGVLSKTGLLRGGIRMLIIGGIAIGVGVIIGKAVRVAF